MEDYQNERIMKSGQSDTLKYDEVSYLFPIGFANQYLVPEEIESAGYDLDDLWCEDFRYIADMLRVELVKKYDEKEFLPPLYNQEFFPEPFSDVLVDVLYVYMEHFFDSQANPIHKNISNFYNMNSYINIRKREERNRELFFRSKTMDKEFEWNEQNVESLLKLNDVLTKLMAKARKQHNAIVRDINNLLAGGKKYYKDFHVETHVYYDFDGKEYELFGIDCADYFAEQLRLGWNAAPFSNRLDELSWDIETLNHPSLKEHKICYLMHVIFAHANFPLQYGIQLNPKKIGFISEVHI